MTNPQPLIDDLDFAIVGLPANAHDSLLKPEQDPGLVLPDFATYDPMRGEIAGDLPSIDTIETALNNHVLAGVSAQDLIMDLLAPFAEDVFPVLRPGKGRNDQTMPSRSNVSISASIAPRPGSLPNIFTPSPPSCRAIRLVVGLPKALRPLFSNWQDGIFTHPKYPSKPPQSARRNTPLPLLQGVCPQQCTSPWILPPMTCCTMCSRRAAC